MSEAPAPALAALYQSVILDHGKSPHHMGSLANATHEATEVNALCGDRITLRLVVEGTRVHIVKFEARGCLIARASASLLTCAVTDTEETRAAELAHLVFAMLESDDASEEAMPEDGADAKILESLRGARAFPARKACVTLAWKTLLAAIGSTP